MIALLLGAAAAAPPADDDEALRKRVDRILAKTPLVDGHNDVPWQYRDRAGLQVDTLDLRDTSQLEPPMHTDLRRLEVGKAGAVFWSVWVPVALPGPEALLTCLEQIDVVHQMVGRYPEALALALTADDVVRIHKDGRIASLVGIEGGHSIGDSLGALRMMYAAGARYMTLTHWKNTAWADAATDAPEHGGLTPFGEAVVHEMNRLGMLVDLSHVSAATMEDALRVAKAPVIFSHSGAFAVNPHPRNVPDPVLDHVKANGGVVMVDYLPAYVSAEVRAAGAERKAEEARQESLSIGDPDGLAAAMKAWDLAHPKPKATLAQVADHLDHVRGRIGAEHCGLGSDFDGMGEGPVGLEDVSKVPDLLVELLRRGWTDAEVAGVAGGNVLRALRAAEEVSRSMAGEAPSNVRITPALPELAGD